MLMTTLDTMQLLKHCVRWTAFIVCVIKTIFFLQSKGWGVGFGNLEKLRNKNDRHLRMSPTAFLTKIKIDHSITNDMVTF